MKYLIPILIFVLLAIWFIPDYLANRPSLEIPPASSDFIEEVEYELPIVEKGGLATSTYDYTTQCVFYNRVNSEFSPPIVEHAKDLPVLIFEPKVDAWAIYDACGQYGSSGHTSLVSDYNDEEGWFDEHGRNLNGEGEDYTRRVWYKGENKDQCLRGFFWNEISQ